MRQPPNTFIFDRSVHIKLHATLTLDSSWRRMWIWAEGESGRRSSRHVILTPEICGIWSISPLDDSEERRNLMAGSVKH